MYVVQRGQPAHEPGGLRACGGLGGWLGLPYKGIFVRESGADSCPGQRLAFSLLQPFR